MHFGLSNAGKLKIENICHMRNKFLDFIVPTIAYTLPLV